MCFLVMVTRSTLRYSLLSEGKGDLWQGNGLPVPAGAGLLSTASRSSKTGDEVNKNSLLQERKSSTTTE